MPIVPMREILNDAKQRRYAVGSYNAINLEMIQGIIRAAEEEQSPVILCHAEVHFKYTSLESCANMLTFEASRAKVPVALLLDHGKSFGAVIRALHAGFNAVMYDGSELDCESNTANTKEIVKIAHALGADVEAELGHVTRPRSGGADGEEDDSVIDDRSLYTQPEQAALFIERTGADALAAAFGTVHGVYLKKPVLDIERLKEIAARVDVPIVMHGGSGLGAGEYETVIHNGVCKINYYTGMACAVAQRIKETFFLQDEAVFYHQVVSAAKKFCCEDAQQSMRLFGSSGKA